MDADIDCSLESSYAMREISEHRQQPQQQQQQQQQQPRRQFHGRNRGAQNSNKYFIESVFFNYFLRPRPSPRGPCCADGPAAARALLRRRQQQQRRLYQQQQQQRRRRRREQPPRLPGLFLRGLGRRRGHAGAAAPAAAAATDTAAAAAGALQMYFCGHKDRGNCWLIQNHHYYCVGLQQQQLDDGPQVW